MGKFAENLNLGKRVLPSARDIRLTVRCKFLKRLILVLNSGKKSAECLCANGFNTRFQSLYINTHIQNETTCIKETLRSNAKIALARPLQMLQIGGVDMCA